PVDPVVGPLRSQRGCQGQVLAGLLFPPALLQRAAEAEVGEVVDRMAVDDCLELLRGVAGTPAAELVASERLADRALLRLHGRGLLKRDRCGREIAVLEQVAAAPVEVVDLVRALLRGHSRAPALVRTSCTASTMAAATAVLGPRGTAVAPDEVTIVTSFWSDSNPIAVSEM